MDGYDWIDREVAEEAWQESQDLMAEFGSQPDYDSIIKQAQIEALEVDQGLKRAIEDGGESELF
jgi:translation elongation factor EF-Tu-like GTPase